MRTRRDLREGRCEWWLRYLYSYTCGGETRDRMLIGLGNMLGNLLKQVRDVEMVT